MTDKKELKDEELEKTSGGAFLTVNTFIVGDWAYCREEGQGVQYTVYCRVEKVENDNVYLSVYELQPGKIVYYPYEQVTNNPVNVFFLNKPIQLIERFESYDEVSNSYYTLPGLRLVSF